MISDKKVLAIIPARGGSKGLPGKNIIELCGKPMIAWTIKEAKKSGAKILSAVNVIGSSITRHSDEVLYLYAGPEIGVAATKTYTAQTLSMWDIGLEIGKISGELGNKEYDEARKLYNKIPSVVKQTIVRSEALANRIASWFAEKNSSFYLGRGINLQTANEGALKMKEIALP